MTRVLAAYEKARKWAQEHPAEYLALVAKEAKITPEVAKLLLERTGLNDAAFTGKQELSLIEAGNALRKSGVLKEGPAMKDVVENLIDRSFFAPLEKNREK